MTVNFNNLRKQAIHRYQSLCEKLNDAIIKNDKQWALPNDVYHGIDVNLKGYVLIDAEDIQKEMDDLRQLIGSIAMVCVEGEKDFADVYEQVFPEKENKSMASFNEEIEEETNA